MNVPSRSTGSINVAPRDLAKWDLRCQRERILLKQLERDNYEAFDRLGELLFQVLVQTPPISELQTILWTA